MMDKGVYNELQAVDKQAQGAFNCNIIADEILSQHKLIFSAGDFYEYLGGYYKRIDISELRRYVKSALGGKYSSYRANEVIDSIRTEIYVRPDELNNTNLINLKNGLFDIETETLSPHVPEVFSTIQLSVNYNKEAGCTKWLDTIYQIFEKNESKIEILQEFFGLCLTKEVKYEKALFMIGEGSNGKSTVLYILRQVLGQENTIAVPLEKLSNYHYVASVFNKLANISIETHAKSSVYDSTFKAIISGDSLTADPKYRAPFSFTPCCKLIYALNNMPRVDDKTDAFYRRLLILRFNKQFSEEEANKNLKDELLEELDGIFLWMIEGYRNLKKRGYFAIDENMRQEISEYRSENNNVLLFVEEECELHPDHTLSKADLYEQYISWCQRNGHRGLSHTKFGKELRKQYRQIQDIRDNKGNKAWAGIAFSSLLNRPI